MIKKYLIQVIILIFPLQGCIMSGSMSPEEVYNLLMQNSINAKTPIHIYVSEDKDSNFGHFQGTPLPVSSYKYFTQYYAELANEKESGEIFAVYQFPQGIRWHFFLLRVPCMYGPTKIDLWVYDKEKKEWLSPFILALEWGDDGESVSAQSWIEYIDKDSSLHIIKRSVTADIQYDDATQRTTTTKEYNNEIFVWDKDHFKDVSKDYQNKFDFNKYRFKK